MQDFLKGRTLVKPPWQWWTRWLWFAIVVAVPLAVFVALFTLSPPLVDTEKESNLSDREIDEQELAKFQGTWEIVAMEEDGSEATPARMRALGLVTFKGREYTWTTGVRGRITRLGDGNPQATIVIRGSSPREVDYLSARSSRNASGIYEFTDASRMSFRDCFGRPGAPRPQAFSTAKGTGLTMITYRRVK